MTRELTRESSKSTYEKIVESIKELSDKKRNNFRKLFFDSLCQKEKLQKTEENNLNYEFLSYVKDLAIGIEDSI